MGGRHTRSYVHDDDYSDEDDSDLYTDSEDYSDDDAGDGFYPTRSTHYPRQPRGVPAKDVINDPYYDSSKTSHTCRMGHEEKRKDQKEAFRSSRADARQKARVKVGSHFRERLLEN